MSFDDDIAEYVRLDAQRAEIQGKLDEIKARIRERGVGQYEGPNGLKVTVTANRRFNPDRAAEILPESLIGSVQRTVVDAKLAREHLPPAVYDACKVEVGEPRVRVG